MVETMVETKVVATMEAMVDVTMGTKAETTSDLQTKPDAEVILHASVATPFGTVPVGRSERGICSVELGDDVLDLERALSTEFPNAVMRSDDATMEPLVAAVARLVA